MSYSQELITNIKLAASVEAMLVQRVGTGWNWQDCQTVPEIF
jgi:uncharacterized protein YfiM (DUF2279 family)